MSTASREIKAKNVELVGLYRNGMLQNADELKLTVTFTSILTLQPIARKGMSRID